MSFPHSFLIRLHSLKENGTRKEKTQEVCEQGQEREDWQEEEESRRIGKKPHRA